MSDVDTLKQEISEKKAELSTKLEALEEHAQELLSPAEHIRNHPFLCMGLSLGAGLLVGTQLPNSKKLIQPIAMGLATVLAKELQKKYISN